MRPTTETRLAASGDDKPTPDAARLPAAVHAFGVLLLIGGIVAGLAHIGGLGFRDNAAAAAGSDWPPRDPELVARIRRQVQQMRDRGIIAAIHDGDPTVVVVTDRYLAYTPELEQDLPLYGGHFVGFADDYAWLVNGTHRVRLVREDGTELGRREVAMSDAQVQAVYRENRRLRDSVGKVGDE